MPNQSKLLHAMALLSLILSLVALSINQSAIYATPAQSAPAPLDTTFGRELLLVKFPHGTLPTTLPPTLQLHAHLYNAAEPGFIASGDSVQLTASNLDVQVLDGTTTDKVYYFVDATAPDAATRATEVGQLLYQDATQLLVAVAKEAEAALITQLPAAGIGLVVLPAAPLPWPVARHEPVSAAAPVAVAADPLITDLLPLLTETDLQSLIRELSGEIPVTIGGDTITLNTRYTFATRIQDAERYLHQYYTQLGIAVAYSPWAYGSYTGRNVIAEIPGTEHPERIWVVGGHFDSISDNPYNLAPGADDNGSGTAATLLIAKIFRDYTFVDTVRFVHFSAEEQGHWGSIVYARDQKLAGAQIMGYIDLDMIGWDGDGDRVIELHTGTGPKSNTLGTAFISANDRYAQGLVAERLTTAASRFSDHSSFWDQDYGAFLAIENFFDGTLARDRNPQYHKTGDKLALVDLNYVARYGRVALATLAELAGIQHADPNATATPTATSTPLPTPTPTPTSLPTGCVDLLVNGDFESSGGWSFGGTPAQARIVNSPIYTGTYSLQMGIPSGVSNVIAHSSAYQTVVLPNTAEHLMLRYWEQPGGSSDGIDYRETLLLTTNYAPVATLERTTAAVPGNVWRERSFDLTPYGGRTVVLYLNVYNNGTGSQIWRYVDQVALLACNGVITTPTPTPTPTATSTATSTATPTATPTLIATIPPELLTERLYLPLVAR